ncbi:MAG: heme NO-binding domain-containing protein [Clostridiales bacterium]|nr:heme NO-binding domain-containing protein [Eubacteriales bacterium]MDH7566629.1 heme NO-binding domain-containing protein [Clostridiales bacterium]
MKGTVVTTWLNSMKMLYGSETVNKAVRMGGWAEDRIINPMEDIDDQEITGMVRQVAGYVNKPVEQIWKEIGRENIQSFSKWFPSYFERLSLKDFLMMMDTVHMQLTKMIHGAKPPRLVASEISPGEMEIRYSSSRGMYDYFLGLIEGSAEFFKEKIEYKEIERGVEGDQKFLRVRIRFEKKDKLEKSFTLSRILSLGFIRSLPLKISVFTSLIAAAAVFALFPGQGFFRYMAEIGLVFLAVFGASSATLRPVGFIDEELKRLNKLDFTGKIRMKSGDDLEKLARDINRFKEEMTKDLLFLKGGTDDMHSFTATFSEIAERMGRVSDGISSAVMDVANGAVHQAEETEKSVNILNKNIESLNKILAEQTEGRKNLEQAVSNIEKSFDDTEQVGGMILKVRDSFSQIKNEGENLSRQVSDILNIATTVASIADQTNLLALNAAIEAARAGESGRGFAVVADEIRKLAENAKREVSDINSNLVVFTSKVSELVEGITSQFNNLDMSNKTLGEVLEGNRSATRQIAVVSQSIASLVAELSRETQQLAKVYENIHSLAAIAQENSASSQEMSANVSEYSERIKDLTQHVHMLASLTDNYQNELKKYSI